MVKRFNLNTVFSTVNVMLLVRSFLGRNLWWQSLSDFGFNTKSAFLTKYRNILKLQFFNFFRAPALPHYQYFPQLGSLLLISLFCFSLFIKPNKIFLCICCVTPKRSTSLRDPSPRHCPRATQLHSKKCRNGGEPFATLCPIWPVRDLNLGSPAPETNALPLDQLAGISMIMFHNITANIGKD